MEMLLRRMKITSHSHGKEHKLRQTGFVILLGAIALLGCTKKESPPPQQTAQTPQEAKPQPKAEEPMGIPLVSGDTVTTASGLKYIDITVGQGPNPTPSDTVKAHYTGWLTDGTKFDSSRDRGAPLEFPIGVGKVIKGWDEGLGSMKVGGRRLLIIPSGLAWGERGIPGGPIPPNAGVVFDVELLSVQNAAATP